MNQTCVKLCDSTLSRDNVGFIKERIEEEYNFNWVVDGLPAAQLYEDEASQEIFYNAGVPLGFTEDATSYLNNHYSIHIHYHPKDHDRIRVVGVVVNPKSLSVDAQKNGCVSESTRLPVEGENVPVTYTYNVFWEVYRISWGT